jgi:signal peptide peptidase SppA
MNLAKMISTLTSEPLLMLEDYRGSLLKLLEDHRTMGRDEFRASRQGTTPSGDKVDLEQMEIDDYGIAHIPIGGPIGMGLGKMEKGAGLVDVEDIREDLDNAEMDDSVVGIILNFDSPGGMVSGIPELATRIQAVKKPIYSFTNGGMIASAAYWLASGTEGIWATKSSDIGSIGVYAPFADMSRMADMQGVKIKVFSSGKYKGMGVPGTSLTAEQEVFMQQRVMEIANMFYDHIRQMRSDVEDFDMQGQVFKADSAYARGFIDHIACDEDELVQFLSH